jgi:hypothetical protein
MIENFLQYGQWVILLLSIYIFTALSRFGGALIFLAVDLPAFVIANLIQTYIAGKGYFDNKQAGEKED